MKKMVRAVLFAMMAVFSTAVFAEDDPCAMSANLTEIDGVYQIGTCGDLYKFAEMVNGGETGINGRLTADIVVNVGVLTSDGTLSGTNFTQWTPIGTESTPYAGTFDGKDGDGHTISGLYFNDENVDYVGLFGKIGTGAVVQNVGVVDSYILGKEAVGGVVGLNAGGTISNVYNTGAVSGSDWVGGVVGYNGGTVSNVYNTGAVSGLGEVGGVVGYNYSTVSNVYNTGAVSGDFNVGGVVGENDGNISNVYNTGAVGGDVRVGGVVGYNDGPISNGYYNADFYTGNAVGGDGVGIENVKGKTTIELAALTFGTADADFPLLEDETESPWESGNISYDKVTGKLTASFPYLKNFADFQYKITALEFKVVDDIIQIANADDLKDFAGLVNEFGVADVAAELIADICLNACSEGDSVLKADGTLNGDGSNFTQWTPIGTKEKTYAGTLDGMDAEGNAHVISGLYFNDGNADFVGLFGYIGENAKVQNVGVVDSYFKGKQYVAGVVGYNDGDLSNVYNTGAVSGEYDVGGVVGYNDDDLTNVYNTGTVSGTDDVGGVVGENIGTVSNVYNTGMVSGIDGAGSVVGYNAGSIANAYYDKDVACANCGSRIGGTTGKTTAELAALDVASAFDDSEGNWNAGYSITSNGWWKYAFPSLKGVGTAPTFVKLDPDAIEVEISNVEELFLFAEFVNAGNTLNGRLTADIVVNENLLGTDDANVKDDGTFDMEAYKSAHANAEPRAWTPIGTASTPYRGIFDGKDGEGNVHTISGLYFIDENARGVGLFGYIGGKHAKIQNVGVVDSYIRGRFEVGGVVGGNGGTVRSVYNTGAVSGEENVGGVVGHNARGGTISNVYNTGAVVGNESVGGVVGFKDGTVSNVYNTGTVSGEDYVGGVVGASFGLVSNVYNTGAVSGEWWVGGVVGENWSSVSNGYYNTDMPCENCGSPIEGTNGKTTAELAAFDVAQAFENSDGVWVAGYDSISNGWRKYAFPSLKGVGTAPTFIELDPNATEVEISNVEELLKFAELVNAGNATLNAKLTADIVVNENVLNDDGTLNVADTSKFVKWTPIGTDVNPYIGTFDGQGHTVSGLYFNNDEMSNIGFFGAVGSDGETKGVVKNVGVVDSYFEGNFFVGGVVGLVMENASVNAVFNTGAVSGQVNVGGVVGVNGGGFVTNVYNTGSVSGEIEDVGGVIGLNVGEARNVYSVGPVSGKFAVGGVVGLNEGGYVANAYYNSEVFEGDSIGGGNGTSENVEGKNSADLVAGTSLELDTAVWVLGGVGVGTTNDSLYYPYLKVFGPHKYVLGDVKKYAITVAVNDKTMGTVTGAGEYEYGTTVKLSATANEGYKFTDWEDDVKTAARTITVTKAETYTANFEAIPSSSSEVESSSSVDESSSSEAVSSSSSAKSSSSAAASSSSEAKSSSSDAESSSSEAASSSSEAKSSSSEAKSSSSSAKSSSSSAKSSSSEAESSSSEAKSSSSQKESIIAQAQLPQFSVSASGKMVSIVGARPNSVVNVFDMQGNLVKTVVATAANFTFALPSAGVYIVKNGYTAKRVNVR